MAWDGPGRDKITAARRVEEVVLRGVEVVDVGTGLLLSLSHVAVLMFSNAVTRSSMSGGCDSSPVVWLLKYNTLSPLSDRLGAGRLGELELAAVGSRISC